MAPTQQSQYLCRNIDLGVDMKYILFGKFKMIYLSVPWLHYCDVIISVMASQITDVSIVYSIVYSGPDQRKHHSSAPLAFVRGIHRRPVNSPHKGQWRGKCFQLMTSSCRCFTQLFHDLPRHISAAARLAAGMCLVLSVRNTVVKSVSWRQYHPCCCQQRGFVANIKYKNHFLWSRWRAQGRQWH